MTDQGNNPATKPYPAEPERRQESLPWTSPKSGDEDPRAADLVRTILESPEYCQADEDVAFLGKDETRGVRLELDYLKAESLLEAHGVRHTIVVFGGTRLQEPRAARRRVADLEAKSLAAPDDESLARRLRIARQILSKSHYYHVARAFGRIVGQAEGAADNRLALVTGGGPGLMEAANRGAHDVGARTIGLNITLPHEQFPNPYLTPGLCMRFRYFAIRKLHFLLRARALVVFPGGYGTLDELFETLTLIQTRKIAPLPVVLVGQDYWNRIFDADALVEEGMIDPEDRDLFWFAETAEETWKDILRWYERAGKPLTP